MRAIVRIMKYFAMFMFIAILTSCVPSRQNPYYKKRAEGSKVNTSQLGRNRYYFSSGYQKKLVKGYKKRKF